MFLNEERRAQLFYFFRQKQVGPTTASALNSHIIVIYYNTCKSRVAPEAVTSSFNAMGIACLFRNPGNDINVPLELNSWLTRWTLWFSLFSITSDYYGMCLLFQMWCLWGRTYVYLDRSRKEASVFRILIHFIGHLNLLVK